MNKIIRFHIGMQRTGSTYLFNLLKSHEDIGLCDCQEVHYFLKNGENVNIEEYKKMFKNKKYLIDTSPKYFQATAEVIPKMKQYIELEGINEIFILVILRNPIDYIYSHWQMQLNLDYFSKNESIYNKGIPNNICDFIDLYPFYLERALYHDRLLQWSSFVGVDNLKIVIFEEFIANHDVSLEAIMKFFKIPLQKLYTVENSMNSTLKYKFLYKLRHLIVKNDFIKKTVKNSKVFNYLYANFFVGKTTKMTDAQRKYLKVFFEDDVNNLKNIIDVSLWKDFQ